MSVLKLKNMDFDMDAQKGTALVDFYADRCRPCRMVSPIVEEMAEERLDLTVGKVNVDESPDPTARFEMMSIPSLIVFKDGKETTRIIGARPQAAILAELA